MSQSKQEEPIYVFTEKQLRKLLDNQKQECNDYMLLSPISDTLNAHYPKFPHPLVISSEEVLKYTAKKYAGFPSKTIIDEEERYYQSHSCSVYDAYLRGFTDCLTQILNQAK